MSAQTGLPQAARLLCDREVAITHDVDHRTGGRAGVGKQEPTRAEVVICGLGHAVGSAVVSNVDLARSVALPDDWFVRRTGIVERRVCGEGETVLTLAAQAVRQACAGADVDVCDLGDETMIIHIQNGLTQLTPPSGIALVEELGMNECRVLAIDGVCAEPIPAVEIAIVMLDTGRCDRVILSAAADFLPIVRHDDTATAGLFGSGAGAIVLSRPDEVANTNGSSIIHASSWKTYAAYSGLGRVRVFGHTTNENGFTIQAGYYEMDGHGLARVALAVLPEVVDDVLNRAGWTKPSVSLVIAHQPNARLLSIGAQALGLGSSIVPTPVTHLGNMGPASLLVNLALAGNNGLLLKGTRVLLLAFGLGFSCGAVALEM
jgi:3-oxoacyl-[acyl-carrier-protein] synthase III